MKIGDVDKGIDKSKWDLRVEINLTCGELLVIHGNVSLVLRHPGNIGPNVEHARRVLADIERIMVETGFMSKDLLAEVHHQERLYRQEQLTQKERGQL